MNNMLKELKNKENILKKIREERDINLYRLEHFFNLENFDSKNEADKDKYNSLCSEFELKNTEYIQCLNDISLYILNSKLEPNYNNGMPKNLNTIPNYHTSNRQYWNDLLR